MKFLSRFFLLLSVFCCLLTSGLFAQDANLPAQYDLRDVNGKSYVSPVKQQGYFGTCWAHAAINAAESNALLKGANPQINLSEKALAYYAFQLQGSKQMNPDEYEGLYNIDFDVSWQFDPNSRVYSNGGNEVLAEAQMSTWNGASTEAEIPYLNTNGTYVETDYGLYPDPFGDWTLPYEDIYDDAYHLQNLQILSGPALTDEDPESYTIEAKNLLMQYGSLTLLYTAQSKENQYLNTKTWGEYSNVKGPASHAVSVVGWDDNYPASNFNITPPGNGAWIVKNSWGTDWGDQGYFYLSYYDQTINYMEGLDVETESLGYSYDKNNQYDFHSVKGDYYGNTVNIITSSLGFDKLSGDDLQVANVFTSSSDQTLRAISTCPYVQGQSKVTASVYLLDDDYTSPIDGTCVATLTEEYENPGFYTIELDQPIALEAGTKYSVVESIVTYNAQFRNYNQGSSNIHEYMTPIPSVVNLPLEYGLKEPYLSNLIDEEGNMVGYAVESNVVTAEPGQSYVYGLNNLATGDPSKWTDITDPDLVEFMKIPVPLTQPDGSIQNNSVTVGNALIKAYTTYGIGDDVINPSKIALTNSETNPLRLSTLSSGTNSASVYAVLEPTNSTTSVTWDIFPSNIATVNGSGTEVTIKALNEGEATLTATTGNDLVATAKVIVNNDSLVCDGIDYLNNTPDQFAVVIRNLQANPAIKNAQPPVRASLFCWSEDNQSDINAKRMYQIPGTNDWIFDSIPVNDTALYNYFINADDIIVNIYASSNPDSNGDLLEVSRNSWIIPGYVNEASVAYIAYCQNTGFVQPTVWNGPTSGNINNPFSTHMEGFRISSGLVGLEINSKAYANGLGWLPEVGDGSYCGTMWQDRALESIVLNVDSDIPDLADVVNLNYRVYVSGTGWTDWVSAGQEAGAAGSGRPIEALEVTLVTKDIVIN